MEDGKIDGKEATRKVKEYFDSIYQPLGAIGLQVKKVEFDERIGNWIVDCSLFPYLGAQGRVEYRVEVNPFEGSIEKVSLLAPSKP